MLYTMIIITLANMSLSINFTVMVRLVVDTYMALVVKKCSYANQESTAAAFIFLLSTFTDVRKKATIEDYLLIFNVLCLQRLVKFKFCVPNHSSILILVF